MKITLAQLPAPAGAITVNTQTVLAAITSAAAARSQMMVVPAHPFAGDAGDLSYEATFAAEVRDAAFTVLSKADELGVVLRTDSLPSAVLSNIRVDGTRVTRVTVTGDPDLSALVHHAASVGTDVVVIAAALPYRVGAPERRRDDLTLAARENDVSILFVNRVGAQDANVYDGGSMVINRDGSVMYEAPLFEEAIASVTITVEGVEADPITSTWPGTDEQMWAAMVCGTRDYVHNNGFTDVILGLSGGIDSAVVAAITVDALGAEHVHGIGMPGPYSSDGSVTDAQALAENLGISFAIASIKDTYEAEVAALGDLLDGPGAQVACENIQARLRALHLFSIANARNALVLNTCQKSEDAVGYATYGGDALGSYAPMVDLLKRDVYRLASWRNTVSSVIPPDTITKPPSAELAPDQQDTDTLPPYEVLDTIIEHYLIHRESPEELTTRIEELPESAGRDTVADVAWVLKMIDRTEWKRQQAPLGPHLSAVSFALRKVPTTNGRIHVLPTLGKVGP